MMDAESSLNKGKTTNIGGRGLIFRRFEFNSRRQSEEESVEDYLGSLRILSERCGYDADESWLECLLLDRFIAGLRQADVRQQLLTFDPIDLPLSKAVKIVVESCKFRHQQKTCRKLTEYKTNIGQIITVKGGVEPAPYFYSCSVCDYDTTDLEDFRLHSRRLHRFGGDGSICLIPARCKPCDVFFRDVSSVRSHNQLKHSRNILSANRRHPPVEAVRDYWDSGGGGGLCSLCGEDICDFVDFPSHAKLVHGLLHRSPCRCKLCGLDFVHVKYLQNHVHSKHRHPDRVDEEEVEDDCTEVIECFVCPVCRTESHSVPEHIAHMERDHAMTSTTPTLCGICGESFQSVQSVKSHVDSLHRGSSPEQQQVELWWQQGGGYICGICGLDILKIPDFCAHIQIEHKLTSQTPSRCKLCEETFTSVYSLKSHMYQKHKNHNLGQRESVATLNDEDKGSNERDEDDLIKEERRTIHVAVDGSSNNGDNTDETRWVMTEMDGSCPTKNEFLDSKVVCANEGYLCGLCEMELKTIKAFNAHAKSEHNLHKHAPCRCKFCGEAFTYVYSARTHLERKHLNVVLFKSVEVGEENDDIDIQTDDDGRKRLTLNRVRKKMKPVSCRICNLTLSNGRSLTLHLRREHVGEANVERSEAHCKLCNATVKGLKVHLETCHKEAGIQCDLCHKQLAEDETMDKHMMRVHVLEDKTVCQFCGDSFRNIASHVAKFHTEDKPHKCELCNFEHSTKQGLYNHVHYHHPKGPQLLCHRCDYKTLYKNRLQKHIQLVHEKERPYSCPHCEKKYFLSRQLKDHIRVKHDNEMFTCGKCNKQFMRRWQLRIHVRSIHEGIWYKCEQCSAKFAAKETYKSHVKQIHENKYPFGCEICGKGFSQRPRLRLHLHKHHGMQSASQLNA